MIQIGFGESGAAALSNNAYTETGIFTGGGTSPHPPIKVNTEDQESGTKVWARCHAVGQNTGTIDFLYGIHEF